ncbi:hypothetical protein ACA910_022150 [Epithemia clementina (nom. ined.)]
MTVPPAKLKAFVASIKEQVLDDGDENKSENVEGKSAAAINDELKKCLLALIRLELAQRGVLWDHDVSDDATLATNKLLSTLQSTAGKSLLSEASPFPKPLLAGSAAMAGKVAEKMASLVQLRRRQQAAAAAAKEQTLNVPRNNILGLPKSSIKKEVEATQLKCREVQETRFLCLLEWLVEDNDSVTPTALWMAAEGYYYRAASFQPDVPLHWKRAWDVLSLYHFPKQQQQENMSMVSCWQASFALEQLKRVATSKQNAKRASELALKLTEAYMDDTTADLAMMTLTEKSALEAFVGPFRSLQALPRSVALAKARSHLSSVDTSLLLAQQNNDDDDATAEKNNDKETMWHFRVLSVELPLMEEQNAIDTLVRDELEKLQRRSGQTQQQQQQEQLMRSKLRSEHLLMTVTNTGGEPLSSPWPTSWSDAAIQLRDAALSATSDSHSYKSRAWKALAQILGRSKEYMQAKTRQAPSPDDRIVWKGWEQIATFVQPLWAINATVMDEIKDDKDGSMLATFQCAFFLVPCMAWMTLNHSRSESQQQEKTSTLVSFQILEQTKAVLGQMLEQAQYQVLKAKSSSTISAAGSTQQEHEAWVLQLACLSTQALIVLQTEGDGNSGCNLATRQQMSDALLKLLEMKKQQKHYSNDTAVEFGTFYLGLLVCWNGLCESAFPFLTSKEALLLISEVRQNFNVESQYWRRSLTSIELMWLDLSEADATKHPREHVMHLYQNVVDNLSSKDGGESNKIDMDSTVMAMVRAHCLRSLAVRGESSTTPAMVDVEAGLNMARQALVELASASAAEPSQRLYPWRSPDLFQQAVAYQIASSRHQVAECLIQLGQLSEARRLLEQTTIEFPKDSNAAFAYGSFLLRMDFFSSSQHQDEEKFGNEQMRKGSKESQVQLLKAAKLDGTNAGPFAVLGYWYESHEDMKRSVGCYSKALVLDPAHPVAGRGLLRLVSPEQLKKALDAAVGDSHSSPVNGWAWQAIGSAKVRAEADCELAVVALLRAARARDIEQPQSDPLSVFYSGPARPAMPNNHALVSILSLIAQCYRYLGRYTASLRMYYAALNEAGTDKAERSLLCACGQIEMELGLLREAAERFSLALDAPSDVSGVVSHEDRDRAVKLTATLGLGVALLLIAQVEANDGKAGAALECLQLAIERCNEMDSSSSCSVSVQKLRGDLHSFGAALPLRAFSSDDSIGKSSFKAQVDFISLGEDAYRKAEEAAIRSGLQVLQASLISDCAINVLLRAQLLSEAQDGDAAFLDAEFERAAELFRRALAIDGTYAQAWSGLGCATLRNRNPLMAQHALCRSIQLDPLAPDPYANLGFLYTAWSAAEASRGVSETLTQVADTPMMWINRAFLLEKEAVQQDMAEGKLLDQLDKIADAYRASLQVTSEPSALIGYAANGLLSIETCEKRRGHFSGWDIKNYGDEYSTSVAVNATGIKILQHVRSCRSTPLKLNSGVPEGLLGTTHASQGILLQPQRAELWLRLSKEIFAKIATTETRARESANAAATKAVLILKHQLEEPSHLTRQEQVVDDEYVNADVFTESLIMRCYTDPSPPVEDCNGVSPPKELQQAMLVSPWNKLARATLLQH